MLILIVSGCNAQYIGEGLTLRPLWINGNRAGLTMTSFGRVFCSVRLSGESSWLVKVLHKWLRFAFFFAVQDYIFSRMNALLTTSLENYQLADDAILTYNSLRYFHLGLYLYFLLKMRHCELNTSKHRKVTNVGSERLCNLPNFDQMLNWSEQNAKTLLAPPLMCFPLRNVVHKQTCSKLRTPWLPNTNERGQVPLCQAPHTSSV